MTRGDTRSLSYEMILTTRLRSRNTFFPIRIFCHQRILLRTTLTGRDTSFQCRAFDCSSIGPRSSVAWIRHRAEGSLVHGHVVPRHGIHLRRTTCSSGASIFRSHACDYSTTGLDRNADCSSRCSRVGHSSQCRELSHRATIAACNDETACCCCYSPARKQF